MGVTLALQVSTATTVLFAPELRRWSASSADEVEGDESRLTADSACSYNRRIAGSTPAQRFRN